MGNCLVGKGDGKSSRKEHKVDTADDQPTKVSIVEYTKKKYDESPLRENEQLHVDEVFSYESLIDYRPLENYQKK